MHILMLVLLALTANKSYAELRPPIPLSQAPIPETAGLTRGKQPIVVNKEAAIQLGKALFWDMNVGSDGMACGSCHFHAGADRRVRNQLDPGTKHAATATAKTFEALPSGAAAGPNYILKAGDFPLFRLEDPTNKNSKVTFSTDDVVSSSGTFLGQFQQANPKGESRDTCESIADDLFHVGKANTRRASVRNAPTVFNAVYNYRNFWDGRANNVFNGQSAYGPRDPSAGVWQVKSGKTERTPLLLPDASLASQAVAPPLDDREMSCQQRLFPELGRKLLTRRPLETQAVSPDDSALGSLRHPTEKGLDTTYKVLIEKAFDKRFWSGTGDFGKPAAAGPYNQMEANFSFFFGLAIQLYEGTLISDQAPFDGRRDTSGFPLSYTADQKHGLNIFLEECLLCHLGPTFSAAAHPKVYMAKGATWHWVDRRVINGDFDGVGVIHALLDVGYTNTSVTPTDNDPGLGGTDPYGNPLSYTQQYYDTLLDPSKRMIDSVDVHACDFTIAFDFDFKPDELMEDPRGKGHCPHKADRSKVPTLATMKTEDIKFEHGRIVTAFRGAFKIPTLRNVELTGPYMHNGSMKSLEEVVEFYSRGGNYANPHHIANLVFPHGFSKQDQSDLVAFLKTLTDERVRWEKAPFDHPEIRVPHGHNPDKNGDKPDQAADEWLEVPAVGKTGRTSEQGALMPFEAYLQ
jgi:cytochrome c peroxidase